MFFAMLTACASSYNSAPILPQNAAWQRSEITVDGAPIVILKQQGVVGQGVHLYIEGDGSAFTPRGQPSHNPTPRNPVALQLMQADTTSATLYYIGRPCQWVTLPHPRCTPARWTTQRFTPALRDAYIKVAQDLAGDTPTEVIGYSGGAWFAAQIAPHLANPIGIRAVAGNLNPNLINQHHRVPRMEVAAEASPSNIPILYYAGGADKVIPPKLVPDMLKPYPCAKVLEIPNTTHTTGWVDNWPTMLQKSFTQCP